jgi:23S rRNA pseudouridine2605 synthase
MPPRFAYWTIILDGVATSFRARERDEMLPLFNQLKKKDPTALLKWFSGGKLWDSPEQAREERQLARVRDFRDQRDRDERDFRARQGDTRGFGDRPAGPRPDRDRATWKKPDGPAAPRLDRPEGPPPDRSPRADHAKDPRRKKDWRPGGDHKDPRDKYKLPPGEARKRWKQRHLGPKPAGPRPAGPKPFGDKPAGPPSTAFRPGKGFGDRRETPKHAGPRPAGPRPFGGKPQGPTSFGGKPAGPRRSPGFKPGGPGRNRPK